MNEVSGRREHCFTGQRAGFERSKVVVEHDRDVVDEFLGESHAPVMDCSGNWIEVDGFLWYYLRGLFARAFSDERSGPSAKCPN